MTHGAKLALRSLCVRYPGNRRNAIDSISLDVQPGEFIVIIGPSGCGKSTLLRTVNRLIQLDSGRIEIDDEDIAALEPVGLRRTIGYSIQAVGLFGHMTVAENIGIVPTLLGWPRERIADRVDELLTLVQIDSSYRARRPRELSGGEAQRVGVARAIAAEPRVLLMDEPFGAVDALVRRQLQDELLRIVRDLKTTTLLVTHDIDEALRLADRIVVMREGRIEQVATPLDLLAEPATPYVRELTHANDAVAKLRASAAARAEAR